MSAEQRIRDDRRDGPLPAHECAEGSSQSLTDVSGLKPNADFTENLSFAAEALESLPSGFVVVAHNGALVYANHKFLAMVGRDAGSLAQLNFVDLLTRGSAIFYDTQFLPSLLLRGSLEEIAFNVLLPDGKQIPVFLNAAVRAGKNGELSQLHLSVFTASQRRLYEAELLRARREFEEIAEIVRRSADGIIRFSAEGRVESWNNGAQQILGHGLDQRKGQSLQSLLAPEEAVLVEEALGELRRGEDIYRETLAVHESGRLVDVSVSLTPHMEAPGILVGFSAIIRDTTTRKKAEKALLLSEKLASVGRLASSIAHEINNPLESVTNLLYILASRVDDPETQQLVLTAQEELARVSHIATHTLRFHKQSSSRTQVNLQSLAESVLALYRARLETAQIIATADCQPGLQLFCFEGELRQIMVNLVANAYDAMRSGGKLIIRAHQGRNWNTSAAGIQLLIADSGIGMARDTKAHLFEPFFSTKGISGTGLGLWITKDLVTKNGGTVAIRSTSREANSGTVVSLFFAYPER